MRFTELHNVSINDWDGINSLLDRLIEDNQAPRRADFREAIKGGVAFLTFAFDIDGVSVEIAKYAACFGDLIPGVAIHCVGGDFGDKSEVVLDPAWSRFELPGANGWDKWADGKWFSQLYHAHLPAGSDASRNLAQEIWRQALLLGEQLVSYIEEHDIGVLFVVNTNSNPGNLALALALVLASEATGSAVISNNHDFYWEGGAPARERESDGEPGPRDHFFRNHINEELFRLIERIYPWDGQLWVQLNINSMQSSRLIQRSKFHADRVFTIGTGLAPEYFRSCTTDDKRGFRKKMGHVLGGEDAFEPTSLSEFRRDLGAWMDDQQPIVLARDNANKLDTAAAETLVLLQPTRVIGRKRIWRDWELIGALLAHTPFRNAFEANPDMTLVLLVTGPVPVEHRESLERIVDAFRTVLDRVSSDIGGRLFLALSAGWQSHETLAEGIGIIDMYQLADLVMFPSLTEGRGLPIAEAAAAGVPMVCSRYQPPEVFAEVVGLHLDEELQIQFEEFAEDGFSDELLDNLTAIMLDPTSQVARIAHNREVARRRYSFDAMERSLSSVLERLAQTVGAR